MYKDPLSRWYFIVLNTIITGFFFFDAGRDSSRHYWSSMVLDILLAAFWIGFTGLLVRQHNEDEIEKVHKEHFERMDKVFKELAEAEEAKKKEQHAEYLADMLHAIIEDVTKGKRAPKPSEFAKIEAAFHDNVEDHYAQITDVAGGIKAEISEKPFPTPIPVKKVETRKRTVKVKTPNRKPVATKKLAPKRKSTK